MYAKSLQLQAITHQAAEAGPLISLQAALNGACYMDGAINVLKIAGKTMYVVESVPAGMKI